MRARKQNSTDYPILFFMADEADHITGKPSLSPTVMIRKGSGSFMTPSGTVSEVGYGWYQLAGHASDRDTLGDLALHAQASGADPADVLVTIVPYNPFDGDSFGLNNLNQLITRLTETRAANMDKLNIDGAVGSSAENAALATAIAERLTSAEFAAAIANIATAATLNAVKEKTDRLKDTWNDPAISEIVSALVSVADTFKADVGGLSTHTPEAVINALKESTGYTAGGNFSFVKVMKLLTALAAARWQDKAGSPGTYELIDPDNGSSVIMEVTPQKTSPQRTVDIKV